MQTDRDLIQSDMASLLIAQIDQLAGLLHVALDGNVLLYATGEREYSLLASSVQDGLKPLDTIEKDALTFQPSEESRPERAYFLAKLDVSDFFSESKGELPSACVIAPFGNETEVSGFIAIMSHSLTASDDRLLEPAQKAAKTVESILLAGSVAESSKKHLEMMLEINMHLNTAATKTDFLYEITRIGNQFLHFDRAVLVIRPDDMPEYFFIDTIEGDETGLHRGMSYPIYNSLVSHAIAHGSRKIYIHGINDSDYDGIYHEGDISDYEYKQVMAFPLEKNRSATGALILESYMTYSPNNYDLEIFEMISQSLGAALTRFSLYERLNNYATIDTLTHLYNLRALKQRFAEELDRAGRYQNTLSVLFLDLDKFKRVNDTHGHLMGDHVLKETAQIIRESVRTSDIVGRYGGEEFVVLMINADADACMTSARRICSAIREHNFEMNEIKINNKISIGLSEFPGDGDTMESLIKTADAAMYAAKRQGGDQVVKYKKGMVPKSNL